jgi:hypothetical protein
VAFAARLRSILVSDGTEIPVPETGVLAIVGPNNTGKSVALREMWAILGVQPDVAEAPRHVIQAVAIEKSGSEEEFQEWLEENCYARTTATGRHYRRPNVGPVVWDVIRNEWAGYPEHFGPNLVAVLALSSSAGSRLSMIGSATLWDPWNDSPSHPLQILYANPELEKRLSEISAEAFRLPVTLSRVPGGAINLHVGTTGTEPTLVVRDEYLEELRNLPLLEAQGDGMRSFMGVMLALVVAYYPVFFVDEPEAFLHPPQARLLGRKLAGEATGKAQVILATHSIDVLLGLLDATDASVMIVRMTREGGVNPISMLPPDQLRELWSDPALRYSKVLDGLFHRGVVLCEGDTDARYYGAVLDEALAGRGAPPHDLLITQVGGKNRFATVVAALRAVNVPAVVIADLDVLRDEGQLRPLIEILGGDWENFRTDWNVVDGAVRDLARNPQLGYVRDELDGIVGGAAGPTLRPDEAERIREVIRVEDGWTQAKRAGIQLVPQGDASERCARLLENLKAIGLFVVDVGEVERWEPGVPGSSSAWVNGVLERGLHAAENARARPFVESAARFFD